MEDDRGNRREESMKRQMVGRRDASELETWRVIETNVTAQEG